MVLMETRRVGLGNHEFQLMRDFTIQCDRIASKKPDIIVVDEIDMEVKIIDVTIPGDSRLKVKNKKGERTT